MKKPLLFAAIFGIMAALFAALYLNSIETTYKQGAQKVKVLVAKDYIDQGTLLDESVVEEKLVPKEYIQPKAVSVLKELFSSDGRKIFMAIVPFEKGEQVTTTKLSMLGIDTGMSAVIPSQKRSMTLQFDSSLISGIIKPGNRVDMIGILQYEDSKGQMQESAFTILQNILVLATGNTILGAAAPSVKHSDGIKAAMQEAPSSGSIPVTVAVTPKEAEVLALVSEKGVVKLALRPTGDDTIV
jgi:pilus assembly protein CpaB